MNQRFRQDIHAVVESRDLILCDLAADQFYLLPEVIARSNAVSTCVAGIALEREGAVLLAEAGLVEEGDPPAQVPIRPVSREICPSPLEYRGRIGVGRWSALCAAGIEAAWRLCFRRFEAAPDGGAYHDRARIAAELGALEFMLRLVPGIRRCLPRALLIRAFMRRRGIRLALIFAVRVEPFEAHCWLIAGDTVIGDRLDYIAGFIPVAQL